MIEKDGSSGKWRVYYLNNYHNHLFKKQLAQYSSFKAKEFSEGACDPELSNQDWRVEKHLFLSKQN